MYVLYLLYVIVCTVNTLFFMKNVWNVFLLYQLKISLLFQSFHGSDLIIFYSGNCEFCWSRDQFQIRPLAIHNSRSFMQMVLISNSVTFICCFWSHELSFVLKDGQCLYWTLAYIFRYFNQILFRYFNKGSSVSFLSFFCLSGWCLYQHPE